MEASEQQRGVIDRVVDGLATVIVDAADGSAEHEIQVPEEELPDGAGEGSVVMVSTEDWTILRVDDEVTDARRTEMEERLDRIRRERGGGRFDHPDTPQPE